MVHHHACCSFGRMNFFFRCGSRSMEFGANGELGSEETSRVTDQNSKRDREGWGQINSQRERERSGERRQRRAEIDF